MIGESPVTLVRPTPSEDDSITVLWVTPRTAVHGRVRVDVVTDRSSTQGSRQEGVRAPTRRGGGGVVHDEEESLYVDLPAAETEVSGGPRVVVAVDGSAGSRAALRFAL